MRLASLFIFLFVNSVLFAQTNFLFLTEKDNTEDFIASHQFVFDAEQFLSEIDNHKEGSRQILLPLTDQNLHKFHIEEVSIFSGKMRQRYANIKSYKVTSTTNKHISGRIAISPFGLSGMIRSDEGDVFFEKLENGNHICYIKNIKDQNHKECGADHSNHKKKKHKNLLKADISGSKKEFRIAIACTGEWSNKYNNDITVINSKINEYLTELNVIYERDLGITFVLIAANDDIVFFDPATDGLSSSNPLGSTQAVISANIPAQDYDLGHAFYEISVSGNFFTGSGVAGLGVVCNDSFKARGWSGCGGNYSTAFWMDIFAHEVGHQFDATHSFYGTSGNCSGSQRSVGNGVEPGSGNSMMSYESSCGDSDGAGPCTDQNISPTSPFIYFHSYSIEQINDFVASSGNCYSNVGSANNAPTITMPTNYTIPKGTPFTLSAEAIDPDGDALFTSWEEIDTDNLALSCPSGNPNDASTSTTAPLFRSFAPSSNGNKRTFPQINDIINNTQTQGEILPQVARSIEMRFSARANNFGGVSYEDMTLTVDATSGPFNITNNNSNSSFTGGQSTTITWDVAGTNTSPISCSNVNILFSTDGGMTFPCILIENVPNDGSQSVTLPDLSTTQGRIKIEAVDNIFFDINNADITLTGSTSCDAISSTINNNQTVSAEAGDPSLLLDLDVVPNITTFSDEITTDSPSASLVMEVNNTGNCTTVSLTPKYNSIKVEVGSTDTYTFTTSAPFFEILNIYEDAYNPSNPCSTWLTSNANYTSSTGGVSASGSTSISLTQGDIIEIVLSGFTSSNTGAFSVNISSQAGGQLKNVDFLPTGFEYKFVIYDVNTGSIIEIVDIADLTNASTYTSGDYKVTGIVVDENEDLFALIGQNFENILNNICSGSLCAKLSTNDVKVTIEGCTPGMAEVTTLADTNSPGSLRYAIENGCGGDVITFAPSLIGTEIILNGTIEIQEELTIQGLGKNNLTISGGNNNRLFDVLSTGVLSISDVTLADGYSLIEGGAFKNEGTVTLKNVLLENNFSGTIPSAFTNLNILNIEAGTTEIKE